jgi:hypothetical protein
MKCEGPGSRTFCPVDGRDGLVEMRGALNHFPSFDTEPNLIVGARL